VNVQHIINRRVAFEEAKGTNIVTGDTENHTTGWSPAIGRRKFLALGGAIVAVAASGAGVAAALIRAGGETPSPRSPQPVGLDPVSGRQDGAVSLPPSKKVRHFALAGTDGFVAMPSSRTLGAGMGAADIDPYFPDPLAPDRRTTYCFSFRNVTGLDQAQVSAQKGHTELCAPLFYSTVDEEIWVTLTNLGLAVRPDLVDSHTLHWHGFRNAIPFYDGVPESSISVPIGRDFTYVYRPQDSGTYMYHCHFEDVEHVTMGMQGIVFVKPDALDKKKGAGVLPAGQQKAYGVRDGDVDGESWYDREFAILLGEIDARAHFNDAHIQTTDWTDFHADFWTFNGRSYPDTIQPNSKRDETGLLIAQIDGGVGADGASILTDNPDDRLASNPLSSLVQGQKGERVLVRFANLGFLNHSIVFPGLEIDVMGRDARFVPASARREKTDTIQIGPGESRDVFITLDQTGTFPFYDRGMARYTGSEDGTNEWVGGQRSEIRVYDSLAPQLKPNGWAGEGLYFGEQPLEAAHAAPVISATGTSTPNVDRGGEATYHRTISGTVQVDTSVTSLGLSNLWYKSAGTTAPASTTAPKIGDAGLVSMLFTDSGGGLYTFTEVNVGTSSDVKRWYWLMAQDSDGVAATHLVQGF
jgi:FtsP/CotA-like multicopper oxidase with cupredoxin domain